MLERDGPSERMNAHMVGRRRAVDGSSDGRLADHVAVVTGGSFGIGRATSLALARQGAAVVVVGRTEAHVAETVRELQEAVQRTELMGLVLDLRRDRDAKEMARRTLDRFGRIDILVAAAGILRGRKGRLKTLYEMSVEEWDEVLDTNLKGVFLTNRAVLPVMLRQQRGQIVNVSSTSGQMGLAYDSAYCASKFAVIGFSEALAEEVRAFGVRVQVVLPGAVDTAMWDQNGPVPRPPHRLPVARVADLIVHIIRLPSDVVLVGPAVVPFGVSRTPAWLGRERPQATRALARSGAVGAVNTVRVGEQSGE
jgi:3-oxoacyl-[acyl-carrier protein] reductase